MERLRKLPPKVSLIDIEIFTKDLAVIALIREDG